MKKLVRYNLLALVIFGVGYFAWSEFQEGRRNYPASIIIETRPGAAVLAPIRQKIVGGKRNIASVIYGDVYTDPYPLPNGVSIIHSGVYFLSSGAVGSVLVWAPPDISGLIEFTLTASATARAADAGSVWLKSNSTKVSLQVSGEPISQTTPALDGAWHDTQRHWEFSEDGVKKLTITAKGKVETLYYALYQDESRRWFLVENRATNGRAYWIEMGDNTLKVALPATMFEPFAELRRSEE